MRRLLGHAGVTLCTVVLTIVLTMSPLLAAEQAASPQATPAEQGEQDAPAEEYIVRGIGVEGLTAVPSKVVLDVIKNTVVGKKFDPDAVRADLQAIIDTGYFSDVEAKLAPEGDGVKVIFVPTENLVVKGVDVESPVLEPAAFRGYFRQADGEVLNFKLLNEDLQNLQDKVIADHGYVVQPSEVSVAGGRVKIKLTAAKISSIGIKGNLKTRENVIRRELTIKPGDILNMNRLSRDMTRLWHLGFFDEIVPHFNQGEEPDDIALEIEVVERKTGSAAFGAGYSTLDGLLGYIEYSEANFLGRGESINVRTEFGQKKNSYDLGFHEPYLFGTKTSFAIDLYRQNADRTKIENGKEIKYEEFSQGGDLTVGRPIGDYTDGLITLKIEDTVNTPKVEGTMEVEESRTRSLIFQSRTDTTDHPFYPLKGMRMNLSVEAAGLFLGGDQEFRKYVGQVSRYFKVGRNNQTLAFRLVGGVGDGHLPTQEKFRVGGAETVRGYRYGEMTGDRMVYANGEYRFKISKALQAALFVDAGQAWEASQGKPDHLKVGYGVGLRLDTPLGIMRLDYGIGEKGGSTFFSLGPSF